MATENVADPDVEGIAWDLDPLLDGAGEGAAGVEALLDDALRARRRLRRRPRRQGRRARRPRPRRRDARARRAAGARRPRRLLRDAALRRPRRPIPSAARCCSGSRSAARRSRPRCSSSSSSGPALEDDQAEALLAARGPRLLPPPPAHRAALPPAPAVRARGAHPRREVADLQQRLVAAVRGAGRGDRRRPARRRGAGRARDRARRGCSRPTATSAARPPRPSPPRCSPGLRVRGFVLNTLLAEKMVDDRLRVVPALARQPQPLQRGVRRVRRGADRGRPRRATSCRAAGTG